VKILAIACVRNEEIHIKNLVGGLIDEGLEVMLIDNGSTDRTVAVARQFLGRGLLDIQPLRWAGVFSLNDQLEAKRAIAERSDHDWIVHVDADEWLSAPTAGRTLHDAIAEVDKAGYNCINFNEFVFVPRPSEDLYVENYRSASRRYYLLRVTYPALLRAWKHKTGLDNRALAGHLLTGSDLRVFPQDFIMRHYIFLSREHAHQKYLNRRFASSEITLGWHIDKIAANSENLTFPADGDPRLHVQRAGSHHDFNTEHPFELHYWEW
jgi:glycosyltransferase involved in cell wall biosynthesis